jgi:hypothetical protein
MLRSLSACSLLALLLATAACRNLSQEQPPSPIVEAKKYYAVLLNNGSVYFGQLEGLGTPYPVLRDVYYVKSDVNPETKAVTNSLVKRGKEWHGPDRMILNANAITFVEPVGLDSRVSKLIEESKNQR